MGESMSHITLELLRIEIKFAYISEPISSNFANSIITQHGRPKRH
jgi:hypothetical protein